MVILKQEKFLKNFHIWCDNEFFPFSVFVQHHKNEFFLFTKIRDDSFFLKSQWIAYSRPSIAQIFMCLQRILQHMWFLYICLHFGTIHKANRYYVFSKFTKNNGIRKKCDIAKKKNRQHVLSKSVMYSFFQFAG